MENLNILFLAVLILFFVLPAVHAETITYCSSHNLTSNNMTIDSGLSLLFENITTNGWVVLEPNDTLNTNGFSLCAAGVYIEKGADLLMTNNSRIQTNILLNYGTINETTGLLVSGENLTNNGTVSLGSQNFLNFTSIYNKGIITHNNFIRNATNFRLSFAGSGGGAAGFISNAEEPGGYTLATGGAAGVDTKGYNGGTPLEKLPSYSFNFSLLDSASGGAVENVPNCCGYAPGGFGVFPLVILSFSFKNNGVIANNGGNGGGGLNSYYSGNTGGGGGGVVEVLFHSAYVQNGTVEVYGGIGGDNSQPSGPAAGNGGDGQFFSFNVSGYILKNAGLNFSGNSANKTTKCEGVTKLALFNNTVPLSFLYFGSNASKLTISVKSNRTVGIYLNNESNITLFKEETQAQSNSSFLIPNGIYNLKVTINYTKTYILNITLGCPSLLPESSNLTLINHKMTGSAINYSALNKSLVSINKQISAISSSLGGIYNLLSLYEHDTKTLSNLSSLESNQNNSINKIYYLMKEVYILANSTKATFSGQTPVNVETRRLYIENVSNLVLSNSSFAQGKLVYTFLKDNSGKASFFVGYGNNSVEVNIERPPQKDQISFSYILNSLITSFLLIPKGIYEVILYG